jgi:hypothetical protein
VSPRLRVRLSILLAGATAGAVAVALVQTASATAGRVGWNEAAKWQGAKVMTYRVDTLTIDAQGWRARVSFRNLSPGTIGVGRKFGVAFYPDSKSAASAQGELVRAITFSKKLPKSLRPGGSWTGTMASPGRLTSDRRIYARFVFGPFSGLPGTSGPIVWITDHVQPVGKGTVRTPALPAPGPII